MKYEFLPEVQIELMVSSLKYDWFQSNQHQTEKQKRKSNFYFKFFTSSIGIIENHLLFDFLFFVHQAAHFSQVQ